MTEIHSSRKTARYRPRRRLIIYILVVLSLIGIPAFLVSRCEVSPEGASLAIIIEGKTYLQSGSAKEDMTESCTPNSVMIYKDGDEVFITVEGFEVQYIVDAMSGNVDLFEYQEVSYEGYFDGSKKDTFITQHSEIQSTETIGEQIREEAATIRNRSNDRMEIKWSFNQKNGYKAEKNCEIHAFWEPKMIAGVMSWGFEDRLVISLTKLAEFYDCTVSYDRDTRVLFITLK